MPVLRSRATIGRGREAPGCSLVIAWANRSYAASDRSACPRRGLPAQDAHAIITTATTAVGASQSRISTGPG